MSDFFRFYDVLIRKSEVEFVIANKRSGDSNYKLEISFKSGRSVWHSFKEKRLMDEAVARVEEHLCQDS